MRQTNLSKGLSARAKTNADNGQVVRPRTEIDLVRRCSSTVAITIRFARDAAGR
jgi:hypothetical protein